MEKTYTNHEGQQGFTLVELAVVMIIIGILIGGILKGQELITNARVTTTASQLESMGAAVNGFIETYNAFPGDMNTADVRLTDCAADPCNNGDGNGLLDVVVGGAGALNDEGAYFFNHLRAGNYISGFTGEATLGFGSSHPTIPVGGGLLVGDTRAGAPVSFDVAEMRAGTYIIVNGITGAVAATSGILTASQAANIDRRLDDGSPDTGGVIAQTDGGGTACRDAAGGGEYNESVPAAICAIGYRM